MERKLSELTNLVEKLNDRIIKAKNNKAISAIETDIILDLLRQCYLVTEQLKTTESESEKSKSAYVAPVVQVIQESREVQPENAGEVTPFQTHEQLHSAVESYSKAEEVIVPQPKTSEEIDDFQTEHVDEFIAPQSVPVEEFSIPQPEQGEEISIPQPEQGEEINIPQPEPIEDAYTPQPEPVEEVNVPQPEPESQTLLPIEEIPVMSFAKVEVPHDIKPDSQSHIDESSTTNIYSAVGAIAPITPEPAEPVKSDYQSHAGTYSRDTSSDRQASISSSHQETQSSSFSQKQQTQSSSFSQKQDTPPAMKTARQTGDLFGGQTIADKLKNEAPSLIDKINEGRPDHTLAHKMQLKPINDLKTAIGINEKFQFVNDLFEGRIDLYNDAISRLNNCGSAFSADSIMDEYLAAHGWNTNAEAYVKLRTFITRRYL